MKVAILTGNQPRHLGLINTITEVAEEVFAICETTSVLAEMAPNFREKPDVYQLYFKQVFKAENEIFGYTNFSKPKVQILPIAYGDLSFLLPKTLKPVLEADFIIVYGSSFIKGTLCDKLIEKKAINLHIGVSPYYRGAACNFWALFDDNPHLVGATVHFLSKRLDSGDILYHALPKPRENPFIFSMWAVKAAHLSIRDKIKDSSITAHKSLEQNKNDEIRYSKISDFDEKVAGDYLKSEKKISLTMDPTKYQSYVDPVFY